MSRDVPNSKVTCLLVISLICTRSCSFEVTSIITSIDAMHVSVLFSVSCASVCVQIKITCMVLIRARSISAGAYDVDVAMILVFDRDYRQEHLCTSMCGAPGICEIETAPHSIETTFTGRNETFQYTEVCYPASKVCSGTHHSFSILRVRWSPCMPSHIDLTMSRNGSRKTVEMHQTDISRRHEAQWTS